ncbi:MAG: transketolase [Pirellulaceae bacterium]|nr:transketolase [Pirellulaceae bacterium]
MDSSSIEQLSINTIRTLSMDGVQAANCGHPGTPMALAPVTYVLWNEFLRFDPAQPELPNRDRFVLSCGHASMLLYSTLHLAGVTQTSLDADAATRPAISLEDIRNFRQLDSPCAGHPEHGEVSGIEMTTGPLGQGVATSVGMAVAGNWFAARYDRADQTLFGFDTYVICSDGDLMEGIGCEAASMAGHLQLSNLCWIYDDNNITIEGECDLAYSEDVATKYESLGWSTVTVTDANDLTAIRAAFEQFKSTHDKPTLIILKSIIGFGSPNKANSHAAHGAPLGADEVALTKQAYGWPAEPKFFIPEGVIEHFQSGVGTRGQALSQQWDNDLAAYAAANPTEAAELEAIWQGALPANWEAGIPCFPEDAKGLATRVSSGQVLNSLAEKYPWMLGGSADLAPSNMTMLNFDDAGEFSVENRGGRNFHFGIREHSMAAICNGMSLSGLRSYCATFFIFTDYLRPALRLSSIMRQGVLYVMTHDSIGLGEDGPTHQPVSQLAACRALPELLVFRPADANEVAQCYHALIQHQQQPSMLVLTRQALPTLCREQHASASGVHQGAYTLKDCDGEPQVLLLGTGSEVGLCLAAQETLAAAGIAARVVSMPCWELFEEQGTDYRNEILPPQVTARVGVEAGLRMGWDRYIGVDGRFVGMDGFGASAPADELFEHFGITAAHVVTAAKEAIENSPR